MIGLKINSDFAHAMTSVALEKAINEHFFFFDGRDRRGVAKAKDDGFVELNLPTRYRQDPITFWMRFFTWGFERNRTNEPLDSSSQNDRSKNPQRLDEPHCSWKRWDEMARRLAIRT